MDEKTLKDISKLTGGKYFRGKDSKELNTIYDELNKLEPIEYEEESYKPKTLLYHYPLGVAIALILIYCFIVGSFQLGFKIFSKS